MVLRSMQPPAWLTEEAEDLDIVVSSRFRAARNLKGHRYPHRCEPPELVEVAQTVSKSCTGLALSVSRNITEAERDYLLGARLISPDFPHSEPGRLVLLDQPRLVSIMVNEEDHLRIQAVSGGWSIRRAVREGERATAELAKRLDFQSSPDLGYLTASPTNLGQGSRRSALFHLVGLSNQGRLNRMIKSLHHLGIATRGLFGESSRGIAAFVQVSGTQTRETDFIGACNHLIREERLARSEVSPRDTLEKARGAIDYAVMSNQVSMRDALLVLGYVRWVAAIGLPEIGVTPRQVDGWVTEMEVFGTQSPTAAARHRADFLRGKIENLA